MTGPATFARDADAASEARERLDRAAASAAAVEHAQRTLVADLLDLWPTSAWRAAGATSAKRWLLAYTHCSEGEAHRLERIAGLCHRHPALSEAVLSGALALSRADTLGRAVTDEREPWLADSLDALLRLNARGCPAEDWSTAIRHWAGLVDQERTVRQVPRHRLTMTQRLFGGGEVHADLSPSAFLNVAAALDAWTDDPDPEEGPYQRGLGERRADALDDVCRATLDPDDTRWGATPTDGADERSEWEEDLDAEDTFDGWAPIDTLDEALDTDLDLTDPLNCSTPSAAGSAGPRHAVVGGPAAAPAPAPPCGSTSTSTCAPLPGCATSTTSSCAATAGASPRKLRSACCATRPWSPCSSTARATSSTPTTPPSSGRRASDERSPPATGTACSRRAPDRHGTATSTTSNTEPTEARRRPRTGPCSAGSTTDSSTSTAGRSPSRTDDGWPPTATAPPGPDAPAPRTNPSPRAPADPATPRPGHRRVRSAVEPVPDVGLRPSVRRTPPTSARSPPATAAAPPAARTGRPPTRRSAPASWRTSGSASG